MEPNALAALVDYSGYTHPGSVPTAGKARLYSGSTSGTQANLRAQGGGNVPLATPAFVEAAARSGVYTREMIAGAGAGAGAGAVAGAGAGVLPAGLGVGT